MTNSEKYLKDEKYIFDIAKGIAEAICYDDMEHLNKITEKEIRNWFTSNIKPTLTEDERVILKNIPEFYIKVRRNTYNEVTFVNKRGGYYICTLLSHLFQFIKERRRI